MTRRIKRADRRASVALAPSAEPIGARHRDVPDLLDAIALATGERHVLRRLIDGAKKSGDASKVSKLRRELRNARDRYHDARTKLVALLDEPAVCDFEAALSIDPRSAEMLPQSDAPARRRLIRGTTDAASFIRWHRIESPFACASVFAAFDRIALGRSYLDEAKRDLANEAKAKIGSDLVAAGERALARVLEVETTTRRAEPSPIEVLLAQRDATPPPTGGRWDATSTTEPSAEPSAASLARPSVRTTEPSATSPKMRQRADAAPAEGSSSGASGTTADAPRGEGLAGSDGGAVCAGEPHEHLSRPADRNCPLETVTVDPNAPIVRRGRWVFPGEPDEPDEDDRPRVRIEDRAARPAFAHVEGPRPPAEGDVYRVAGSYSKTKKAPAKPITPPTFDTRSGRWVSPGDAPVRDATRGAPPDAAARLAALRAHLATSREGDLS